LEPVSYFFPGRVRVLQVTEDPILTGQEQHDPD